MPIEPPSSAPRAREQLALDALDVRPVRHDEHRIAVERAPGSARGAARLCRRSPARRAASDPGRRPSIYRRPAVRRLSSVSARGPRSERASKRVRASGRWLTARLRLAAPPRGRVARHLAGAVVAEIRLLRAAAGVGVVQAKRRALSFADFTAAVVANENGLSRHWIALLERTWVRRRLSKTREEIHAASSRPANSPRTQQARAAHAPRDRDRYRARRRRANGAAENRRSFGRRDTARRRPG